MQNIKRSGIVPILMSVLGMAMLFAFPEEARLGVSKGLGLCAHSIIPSLFPFLVLSSIFVSAGGAELAGRIFGPLTGRIFGLGSAASGGMLLGWLCGFNVGVRCISELYAEGRITSQDAERASALASLPSPGFFILTVGQGMLGKGSVGVLMYLSVIISLCICGALTKGHGAADRCLSVNSSSPISLSRAISSAAVSITGITACIVFFSTVCEILSALIPRGIALAGVASVLDFSVGVREALPLGNMGAYLAVSASAFCGISAHIQVCGALPVELSKRCFFLCRFAAALLSHLIFALLIRLFGLDIPRFDLPTYLPLSPLTAIFDKILIFSSLFVLLMLDRRRNIC